MDMGECLSLERLESVFVLNSVIFRSFICMFWYTFSLLVELVKYSSSMNNLTHLVCSSFLSYWDCSLL